MTIKFSIKHNYPITDSTGFSLNLTEELPNRGLTAIFGESGCGKTSLLRAIAGLDNSITGQINFNGIAWQDSGHFLAPHKRSIAYVFQEPSLFDHLNVEQNLNFAIKRCKKPSNKNLLTEIISLLEIEHLLFSNSKDLSGGEKQRVAIARAILSQPDLLLMDEPLSALDHRRKQEFLPFLEELKENLRLPILYVTHSVNEVMRLADYMLVLENGRRKAIGEVKEVLKQLDYELTPDSGPSTLIEANIATSTNEWGLATLTFSGGELFVTSDQINPSSKNIRFQINAKDVSIALHNDLDTSIQNRIKSTINKIQELDSSHCLITLIAGDDQILASLTRKAVFDLKLEEQQEVFAQIKSVAIVK